MYPSQNGFTEVFYQAIKDQIDPTLDKQPIMDSTKQENGQILGFRDVRVGERTTKKCKEVLR